MKRPFRRPELLWPALSAALACTVTSGLGLWQLQRRAEKAELIAEISARAQIEPQALPVPAEWPRLLAKDYQYRHVVLEGTFVPEKQVLVFRASGGATGIGEPGYLVLTPLKLASGASVIVNRGFVPQSHLDSATLAETARTEETRITGLMRAPEPRNLFTPPDDPAHGRYFTRDPVTIAADLGLQSSAPFSIDADASADMDSWPRGGTTELRIPDNHLSYALTWFGLAVTGAVVFCTYARTQRRASA